tara:strand:- start:21219 stop:21641 length:423 start_codon:yes stop_codon:yes gene_type:complete
MAEVPIHQGLTNRANGVSLASETENRYDGAGVDGTGDRQHEKYDFSEKTMPQTDYQNDFEDEEDDEEDEDIDALIDELESQDGGNADYEEEEADQPGGMRLVPEELLLTDTRMGLNSAEVMLRRKRFGYNQMKGLRAPRT